MTEPIINDSRERTCDVVVLGGGLAGLTLALQIKQARPETEIVVLERNVHPVPEAAFKVGESTLEGAAHYLGEILGLKEHLESEHFFKAGFRFFLPQADNSQIEQRAEIGLVDLLKTKDAQHTLPSYQIDRGRFENELGRIMGEMGIAFWDGAKIKTISLDESPGQDETPGHRVTVERNGSEHSLQTRWVMDASGRAALLRRQLGLTEKVDHPVNAAWFRVNQRLNTNLWSRRREWRTRVGSAAARIFCTTHLSGPGYWVWIIPLAPNVTSVGLVADESHHPFGTFNRLERCLEWLERYEPQCAQAIDRDEVLDFAVMGNYANGCKQVFSHHRWSLTGIAGAFTDPLFSPGSEMIAVSNTLITDLVVRSLAGEDIEERTRVYNRFYLDFLFNVSMQEYLGQYPRLGDTRIVTLKKIWQSAWYWGIWSLLICHHEQICDLALMAEIEADLQRFSQLQRRVQEFFRTCPLSPQSYPGLFIDYTHIQSIFQLHLEMALPLTNAELKKKIAENVRFLEMVAGEIMGHMQPGAGLETGLTPPTAQLAAEFDRVVWDVFEHQSFRQSFHESIHGKEHSLAAST